MEYLTLSLQYRKCDYIDMQILQFSLVHTSQSCEYFRSGAVQTENKSHIITCYTTMKTKHGYFGNTAIHSTQILTCLASMISEKLQK